MVAPAILIYASKLKLEFHQVHALILASLFVSPTIAFSIHGYVLKRCGLEIQTDFITKNEDPCQDLSRPQFNTACNLGIEEKWKPVKEDFPRASEDICDSNEISLN